MLAKKALTWGIFRTHINLQKKACGVYVAANDNGLGDLKRKIKEKKK